MPNDAPRLTHLLTELILSHGEVPPREIGLSVRHLLGEDSAECLVAVLSDELVGMAQVSYRFSTFRAAPFGYLDDVFVASAHRGRGIARQLIAAAQARAMANGCVRIELDVWITNASAREMYEHLGFRETGSVLMSKDIRGAGFKPARGAGQPSSSDRMAEPDPGDSDEVWLT